MIASLLFWSAFAVWTVVSLTAASGYASGRRSLDGRNAHLIVNPGVLWFARGFAAAVGLMGLSLAGLHLRGGG